MISLAKGAGQGLLRGLATALTYALLLGLEKVVLDVVDRHVLDRGRAGGMAAGYVFLALFVALIAGVVGTVGGLVFGAALVPLVNRWTGSRRALGWSAGAAFTAAGLLAFPTIPLGWGSVTDLEEALTLRVLPALLAGGAATWHVTALHRLRTPPTPSAAAGSARPTGAASDG